MYPDFSTLKQTKTCRTQLYHMSYTFYSSDDGVSDRGWGVRQQDSCFCYLSSFLFLVHLLLSAVCSAAVSALYPVIVSAVTALSHPVCPLSSSDSGAWIPSPAQRSELQSLPAAAGHRHPLWGHQTVSFTVPACQ